MFFTCINIDVHVSWSGCSSAQDPAEGSEIIPQKGRRRLVISSLVISRCRKASGRRPATPTCACDVVGMGYRIVWGKNIQKFPCNLRCLEHLKQRRRRQLHLRASGVRILRPKKNGKLCVIGAINTLKYIQRTSMIFYIYT